MKGQLDHCKFQFITSSNKFNKLLERFSIAKGVEGRATITQNEYHKSSISNFWKLQF